ncbi:uncharacterized protein ACLA_006110 [Aspergillus clavatus NRRL 1]|uniref:Uncharacterized protein n=1 Tax=Aspergillus clavatus (strain ATCC 1007 / CBS 513.65 / DSM 816 / NCTC 3887 / NRRL 1 / QM 1276 / 107) TaxID=344612 RepID=A1CDC7_ASPCL|nr:uncharacterized protein ACLA_006110 [Aspergillus clavatus NRRL 1]EAW11854.1 conserved hypothetical protein [Aspergillus clavatus NRRL 1]
MYGSHFGSSSSGPPASNSSQPEWRLPATAQPSQSSWPPAPPPPPSATVSPPPSYHPNTYGYISSPPPVTSGSPGPGTAGRPDTSSWGVRYNRQQHVQSPPPLPPRPTSALEQQQYHHAALQSPTVGSTDAHKPLPATPNYGSQPTPFQNAPQWSTGASYTSQPVAAPLPPPPPPPPPPIPPDYQNQLGAMSNQTWQQPHPPSYSDLAPSQQLSSVPYYSGTSGVPAANMAVSGTMSLPPPTVMQHSPLMERPLPQAPFSQLNPISTVSTYTSNAPPVSAPPVPPKTGPNVFPAHASNLGPVSPSDWEHLAPFPSEVDDVGIFSHKQNQVINTSALSDSRLDNTIPFSSEQDTQSAAAILPTQTLPSAQPARVQPQLSHQQYAGGSPISPSTTPEIRDHSRPARVDSVDTKYSVISAAETSENIDGVIEAWNQPISSQGKTTLEHAQTNLPSASDRQSPALDHNQVETPELNQGFKVRRKEVGSRASTPAPTSTTSESPAKPGTASPQPKPQDPFEDLDPWSKSSLARYIAMLRKEEVADSDAERFKIFTTFMGKETKLREILYSLETEQESDKAASSQALPKTKVSPPVDSGLIPVESEGDYFASTYAVEDAEGDSYSPGGRPVLPRLHTPHPSSLHRSASQPNVFKGKVSKDPSIKSETPFSRSTSVPPSMNDKVYSPVETNPPQPIYIPFRYTEGPQRGSENLSFARPAYQAYSALRQASAESRRVMSNAPKAEVRNRSGTVTSSVAQSDYEETFIGLIREKSVAYRNKSSRRKSSPPPLPASLRQGKADNPIAELRSMISSPLARQSGDAWHVTTGNDIEKYTNDFSYIREAVNRWETAAATRRADTDKERMRRQEESETHIDALFNEKEIGYADINVLEEEFRQTEARVQLDEERQELDNFVADVFDPLDERLKKEISGLQDHYESALSRLDHENNMTKDSMSDRHNLSQMMKVVNDIYHKLEVRYQKRLEIALDRERRRKKTERRPLVFMGDSAALKKLDGEFDQMERRNILEAAKERDDRANRLMDSFDNAIILGLGENQSLLDEVTGKIMRIDSAIIQSSGLAASEVEQLLKSVFTLVESVRRDTESILHNFGVADTALNNADYSLSVAEARYSNADPEIFRKLDDEKKKEDAKIQRELCAKLESVRVSPSKIVTQINGLLKSLGKTPVVEQPATSDDIPAVHPVDVLLPGPRPPTVNTSRPSSDGAPKHQERLRKALEDAKKRNAARTSA